jgi:hypothetical protein
LIPVRYVLLSNVSWVFILLFNLPAALLSSTSLHKIYLDSHRLLRYTVTRPAAPSSRYPAAASSRYHSAASPCYRYHPTPLPAWSRQLLVSAALPARAPCLVHPVVLVVLVVVLVVVVAVPVVPQPWFSSRRRWCSVSQVVVGSFGLFPLFPFPSLALVSFHVFVVAVLVLSSFGCILLACLPGAPPRLASFSWPCLVVTAIPLLPLTRRLGSAGARPRFRCLVLSPWYRVVAVVDVVLLFRDCVVPAIPCHGRPPLPSLVLLVVLPLLLVPVIVPYRGRPPPGFRVVVPVPVVPVPVDAVPSSSSCGGPCPLSLLSSS